MTAEQSLANAAADETQEKDNSDSNNLSLVVAGLVGVLVILIVIAAIIFVFRTKARTTQPTAKIEDISNNELTKVVAKQGMRQPRVPRAPVKGTITNVASRD